MAGMKLALMASMMIMLMVASMQMQSTMAQNTHVVGDAFGWNTPPDGEVTYQTWVSGQTFNVNDTLYFSWQNTVYHTVAVVESQAAYDLCNTAEITSSFKGTVDGGSTRDTIILGKAGPYYIFCENHCQSGQKLAINVLGPTPTTPTAENPPITTVETSPPSPSTGARSFTAVIPATFMAVALVFFY